MVQACNLCVYIYVDLCEIANVVSLLESCHFHITIQIYQLYSYLKFCIFTDYT